MIKHETPSPLPAAAPHRPDLVMHGFEFSHKGFREILETNQA